MPALKIKKDVKSNFCYALEWRPYRGHSLLCLLRTFVLALIVVFCCQSVSFAEKSTEYFDKIDEKKGKTFFDKVVLAPIPLVNPTLGAGLIGAAMYMHPHEDFWNSPQDDSNATRQSITGAAAMYSSSESWSVGLFHKGYYDDDNYRGTGFLAEAGLNLKYYGIGDDSIFKDNPIEYSAKLTAFKPQFLFRIADDWFLGIVYSMFHWQFDFNLDRNVPSIIKDKLDFTTAGLGIAGTWDTTDNNIYPTKGGKLEFSIIDYGRVWGGDFEYVKALSNYSHYFSLSDDLIFACQGELNFSSGSTPFFDMPYLHLRGFPYAQYIDKQSASAQGEFRYKLTSRWAVSVFGGLGWVADTPENLLSAKTIPTGGAGVKYLLAEKEGLYLSMDLAFGPSTSALYFRLGEWF